MGTIGEWLTGLKLERYEAAFVEAGYDDVSVIPALDDADLDAVGVTLPGHRKRILLNGMANSNPNANPIVNVNHERKR